MPLWRGDHVAVKQVAEDFARFVYLPRLRDPQVLTAAVQDGLGLLLWSHESFAYADSYDDVAQRYRALRCGGGRLAMSPDNLDGLLVKPEVALRQQTSEAPTSEQSQSEASSHQPFSAAPGSASVKPGIETSRSPRRFHGSVTLDSKRVGRDAGRIADEVIAHLEGLIGAEVTVTLEIEANIPGGAPDNVVRTVTENSRVLKFSDQGFEES